MTSTIVKDLLIGVGLGVCWVGVYGLTGWPAFADMFLFDLAKLASVPPSLSAGICEEFLFRGFVVLMIARAGGSRRSQVIWSSVAFGAAHVLWGPIGMLFTVALGLSFAVVTMKRGNVWAAIVAHSILNLCIEPALMSKTMAMKFQ